jgi:cytochrome c
MNNLTKRNIISCRLIAGANPFLVTRRAFLLNEANSNPGLRSVILIAFIFISFRFSHAQQNNPPVVIITDPPANNTYPLNTLLPYFITVSDVEDGESKYEEINNQAVYLRVQYRPDTSKVAATRQRANEPDPPGFVHLQKSNCITCHAFKTPLIGPSFAAIAVRYPPSKASENALAERIIGGSSGRWGSAIMPGHPELSLQYAKQIVAWILRASDDANTNYYVGTKGVLRLTIPDGVPPGGYFVIRASYTDHGSANQNSLQGADVIFVYGK